MTRWKYDADQRDTLTSVRVPVVGMFPLYPYLAAFHRGSLHRPTARETGMLTSFIDMVKESAFSVAERRAMAEEPFDIHRDAVTVIFHKYRRDDWGYRLSSWPGSMFCPPSPKVATRTLGPMTLTEVMDLTFTDVGRRTPASVWTAWKDAHSEVFG